MDRPGVSQPRLRGRDRSADTSRPLGRWPPPARRGVRARRRSAARDVGLYRLWAGAGPAATVVVVEGDTAVRLRPAPAVAALAGDRRIRVRQGVLRPEAMGVRSCRAQAVPVRRRTGLLPAGVRSGRRPCAVVRLRRRRRTDSERDRTLSGTAPRRPVERNRRGRDVHRRSVAHRPAGADQRRRQVPRRYGHRIGERDQGAAPRRIRPGRDGPRGRIDLRRIRYRRLSYSPTRRRSDHPRTRRYPRTFNGVDASGHSSSSTPSPAGSDDVGRSGPGGRSLRHGPACGGSRGPRGSA